MQFNEALSVPADAMGLAGRWGEYTVHVAPAVAAAVWSERVPVRRHTLATMLGRGPKSTATPYRRTVYRFPDGTTDETAFFGLALRRYLGPDVMVVFGTSGSQWSALVEHVAEGDEEEDARFRLAEAESAAAVEQPLLEELAPVLRRAVGCHVDPRLIPFGQNAGEQYDILAAIADAVPDGEVSFDLTHGFRHLGMVGFLSAYMLQRVRTLSVRDLWYGALDMTRHGTTPVLRLDGLVRVRRWVEALDRFDATGDYGVFAPLLIEDGVKPDKAACLRQAAFHERTSNVWDAARQIGTFLPVLDEPLTGASGLFQHRLAERLRWGAMTDATSKQRTLAYQYLGRHDYLRAAVFSVEACITRVCEDRGVDPLSRDVRERTKEDFQRQLRDGEYPEPEATAYWTLNSIRNALAHGSPPNQERYQRMLANPDRLRDELKTAIRQLLG